MTRKKQNQLYQVLTRELLCNTWLLLSVFYYRPKDLIPILDPPQEREIRIQFNAVIRLDIWEWEEGQSSIYMRFGHVDLGNFEIDFGPCKVLRLASNGTNTVMFF